MCHSVCSSVLPFVRPSLFFLLVSVEFLLVLKSFNGGLRLFKKYLKFKGSFKDVSRMFQRSFKGVYRKFQVPPGSLKDVSKKFQKGFGEVFEKFQGSFQKFSTKTKGFSK